MTTKNYPPDTLDQCIAVLRACKEIDPDMKLGKVSQQDFADMIASVQDAQKDIEQLALQQVKLRNRRDDQLAEAWETIKRLRYVVKGTYGDDSSEYELVGGRRMSERKKSNRKLAA